MTTILTVGRAADGAALDAALTAAGHRVVRARTAREAAGSGARRAPRPRPRRRSVLRPGLIGPGGPPARLARHGEDPDRPARGLFLGLHSARRPRPARARPGPQAHPPRPGRAGVPCPLPELDQRHRPARDRDRPAGTADRLRLPRRQPRLRGAHGLTARTRARPPGHGGPSRDRAGSPHRDLRPRGAHRRGCPLRAALAAARSLLRRRGFRVGARSTRGGLHGRHRATESGRAAATPGRRSRGRRQRHRHHRPRGTDHVGEPGVHRAHRMEPGRGQGSESEDPEIRPARPRLLRGALADHPIWSGVAGRDGQPPQGRELLLRGADDHARPGLGERGDHALRRRQGRRQRASCGEGGSPPERAPPPEDGRGGPRRHLHRGPAGPGPVLEHGRGDQARAAPRGRGGEATGRGAAPRGGDAVPPECRARSRERRGSLRRGAVLAQRPGDLGRHLADPPGR